MDTVEIGDKIPIPVLRKKTFRLFGFIAFSITKTDVVEFNHADYYEKMREQISTEILQEIKGMVNNS